MIEGKRVVVVGASSGLGRSIGLGLAARGAKVAFLARRKERISDAAAEAGPDCVAVVCDVTDESSCRTAIDEAAEALGGIDTIVYSTGIMSIAHLTDIKAERWAELFATNVTGAALATTTALPYLKESNGTAIYLSSISASVTPPWPLAGGYVVSKAALDKMVDAWRYEHPDIGFTRIVVGDCGGGEGHSKTEFIVDVDSQLFGTAITDWMGRGYVSGHMIDVDELVNAVEGVVRIGASAVVPSLTILPRHPSPVLSAMAAPLDDNHA